MNFKADELAELAFKCELTYDGGDDNRLFYDDEQITVFANLLDSKTYAKMEKQINKAIIKRAHYEVYAWNDCGGYKYWRKRAECGDSNYIMITANIKNPSKVRPEQLKRDIQKVFNQLCHWNNVDEFYCQKQRERA